jgi:hypothetical protein
MADEFGYQGAQDPQSDKGEFNAISFLIAQMIARLNVATVVKIVAVDDPGGAAAAGTVDVQPMVNQLDGSLTMLAHGTIYALPYMRLQGGSNAFVVVPQVGDLGIALFADRDISSVKTAKDQANPGSLRRFDMADGMYLGGMLNGAPSRFVRIDDSGVTITGVENVTINGQTVVVNASTSATVVSPDIQLQGDTTVTGALHITGDVLIGGSTHGDGDIVSATVSLQHHLTTLVTPGLLNSGPPKP